VRGPRILCDRPIDALTLQVYPSSRSALSLFITAAGRAYPLHRPFQALADISVPLIAGAHDALKRMGRELRRWRINCRNDKALGDLARMFNVVVQGWINTGSERRACHTSWLPIVRTNRVNRPIHAAIVRTRRAESVPEGVSGHHNLQIAVVATSVERCRLAAAPGRDQSASSSALGDFASGRKRHVRSRSAVHGAPAHDAGGMVHDYGR
jgi:hypothetical protein